MEPTEEPLSTLRTVLYLLIPVIGLLVISFMHARH